MDVYEFPSDHIGCKTYVHVEGHRRSIPVVYTYKGTDGRNHLLPEYGGTDEHFAHARGPMVMRDIAAFVSPVDGSRVSSRSQAREHLTRHNLIEVGNERLTPPADRAPMTRAGNDIVRAMTPVGG